MTGALKVADLPGKPTICCLTLQAHPEACEIVRSERYLTRSPLSALERAKIHST